MYNRLGLSYESPNQLIVFYSTVTDLAKFRGWSLSTATTGLAAATGLAGQDRHAEAVPRFEAALALAPGHFHLLMNLGASLHQVGRTADAIATMQASLAIRNDLVKAHENLADVYLELERWDDARARVAATPYPDSDPGRRQRAHRHGRIELNRAIRALARADKDLAADAAEQASAHYAVALAGVADDDSSLAQFEVRLAKAITDDDTHLTAPLLQWMCNQPTSWRRLSDILQLLPPTLDANQTGALREYLRTLVDHFAPDPTK